MRIREVLMTAVASALIALPFLLFVHHKPSAQQILSAVSSHLAHQDPASGHVVHEEVSSEDENDTLESMLASAATPDKTVIITTLNQAWAAEGTMIDIFLESFRRGNGTGPLLRHLVIVALDQMSHDRCRQLHPHCFMLKTDGVDFAGIKPFMSADFLKMMWRRMKLLRTILEMGYSFIFSDADIVWFRNPFDHFAANTDFQISCDRFRGDPFSEANKPNCGYVYVRSNNRTIAMYRHWCDGGKKHPAIDEQTLLNTMLKRKELTEFGVKVRFLDTERFSGFCQKSGDMTKVVTMHANCCTGLENKIRDLRLALDDWQAGKAVAPPKRARGKKKLDLWHAPAACRHSKWPSPPGGKRASSPSAGTAKKRDSSTLGT